jgi:hypothetical protein
MTLDLRQSLSLYVTPTFFASQGTSEQAKYVLSESEKGINKLKSLNVFGIFSQKAFENLDLVFQECSDPDWDGYSAEAVSKDCFEYAVEFIKALPLGSETPSIGAEADGQLTMEWYRAPSRTLSISISPQGELYYAALLGGRKAFGSEPFYGEVPEAIIRLINQVIKE